MSITLDNASANDVLSDAMTSELGLICEGEYFHVRCYAHILNLVVQDGLKKIVDSVIKVRDTVKYCKGSQARRQRFLDYADHNDLDCARGLRQDVPTRWNSTYLMLENALYYKKAFIHLKKVDANYIHCQTEVEWVKIEKIFRFLRVFYDVTNVFSGTLYPTANVYFPNVIKVRLLLKEEMESADMFMQRMAKKMFEKFSKYSARFSTIIAIAVVLDPRFKYQCVEWGFKKVYGDLEGEIELSKFKEKLETLYNAYKAQTSASTSSSAQSKRAYPSDQGGDTIDITSDEFMTDFNSFSSEMCTGAVKSDLEMNLEEKLIPRATNIDILYHWKTCEVRYPLLSRMAKDVLAIPISTVVLNQPSVLVVEFWIVIGAH
ncbi:hypothetical protein BVRB_7g165530 [Beta vulgaris subsp. vulgaris]|nr:hypothetical protein BVRB_7g165530 [Beta vulgaris subsp. vulgaris]